MPARSRLSILVVAFTTALAACSSSSSEERTGPSSGEDAKRDDTTSGGTTTPGVDATIPALETGSTYEAPDGQPCATPGAYAWKIDLVLPDGDIDHCTFGKINQALFDGTEVPLPDDGLDRKECTASESKGPAPCDLQGTRCNWQKTTVGLQDGEGGTKIGKVTMVTGARAFSPTKVAFFGSEHHVLNDGTDMFPKCSWVITGTARP